MRFIFSVLLLTVSFNLAQLNAADKSKILILSGKPSHKSGDHEFYAGSMLLAKALNEQSGLSVDVQVQKHVHLDNWPSQSLLETADAVIFYMDGWKKHPINGKLKEMQQLRDKGIGIMCMHYGVHVSVGETADKFLEWLGGYYETGWSTNPHWVLKSILHKDHPIARGVNEFKVKDEWYYNMRFRKGMKGVSHLLKGIPDKDARAGKTSWPRKPYPHIVAAAGSVETVMWSVENPPREGQVYEGRRKGRGVGFTGGHYHKNWAHDEFRKIVLNAIIWTAGLEVPESGVKSLPISEAEINANLDKKKKMIQIKLN